MTAIAVGHMAMILLAIIISAARIVAWILDWRAHTATASIREQAFIAQVRAEVSRG